MTGVEPVYFACRASASGRQKQAACPRARLDGAREENAERTSEKAVVLFQDRCPSPLDDERAVERSAGFEPAIPGGSVCVCGLFDCAFRKRTDRVDRVVVEVQSEVRERKSCAPECRNRSGVSLCKSECRTNGVQPKGVG